MDFTDLLPDKMRKPIVIEIRGSASLEAGVRTRQEGKLEDRLALLVNDDEYQQAKAKFAESLGADGLQVVMLAKGEHWRRTPDKASREVSITVHLPPSVGPTEEDEQRAARTVMEWFESTPVGRFVFSEADAAGIDNIDAVGARYQTVGELARIARGERLKDGRNLERGGKSPKEMFERRPG